LHKAATKNMVGLISLSLFLLCTQPTASPALASETAGKTASGAAFMARELASWLTADAEDADGRRKREIETLPTLFHSTAFAKVQAALDTIQPGQCFVTPGVAIVGHDLTTTSGGKLVPYTTVLPAGSTPSSCGVRTILCQSIRSSLASRVTFCHPCLFLTAQSASQNDWG
jgi:hypothetical protein